MSCEKWLDRFETLADYCTAHGTPWTVGTTRGSVPSEVAALLRKLRDYDRLAIPKDADNYVDRVTAMFGAVASGAMWNVLETYRQRDVLLGTSGKRVASRTTYAAPDGNVDTAYIAGREVAEETLPMSETADRAIALQDGLKDAVEEAVAQFTFCFLGVLA